MKREAWGAAAGLLSGLGLAMSGLTHPEKVLDFLDITGRWDPSLLLTVAAALAVCLPAFAWSRWRSRSRSSGDASPVPAPVSRRGSHRRLLAGSAILGTGCGIAGYIPATALASLAHAATEAALFVMALLVGSQLARFTRGR